MSLRPGYRSTRMAWLVWRAERAPRAPEVTRTGEGRKLCHAGWPPACWVG